MVMYPCEQSPMTKARFRACAVFSAADSYLCVVLGGSSTFLQRDAFTQQESLSRLMAVWVFKST